MANLHEADARRCLLPVVTATPGMVGTGHGDPALAAEKLGWRANYRMADIVRMMVDGEKSLMP